MPKKVQVTFSNGQWKLIQRLKGTIGETDSEIVRNIVISYLSEKSYVKEEVVKNNMQEKLQTRHARHIKSTEVNS
jgi:hypothetical protein